VAYLRHPEEHEVRRGDPAYLAKLQERLDDQAPSASSP